MYRCTEYVFGRFCYRPWPAGLDGINVRIQLHMPRFAPAALSSVEVSGNRGNYKTPWNNDIFSRDFVVFLFLDSLLAKKNVTNRGHRMTSRNSENSKILGKCLETGKRQNPLVKPKTWLLLNRGHQTALNTTERVTEYGKCLETGKWQNPLKIMILIMIYLNI